MNDFMFMNSLPVSFDVLFLVEIIGQWEQKGLGLITRRSEFVKKQLSGVGCAAVVPAKVLLGHN